MKTFDIIVIGSGAGLMVVKLLLPAVCHAQLLKSPNLAGHVLQKAAFRQKCLFTRGFSS